MIKSVEFVTVQCPDCGPALVPLEAVNLRINRESDRAALAFPCVICGIRTSLPITDRSVMLLRNAGIEPAYWSYPRELFERDPAPSDSFPDHGIEGLMRELESDIDSFLRSA
ncbi:MAG: hypothetical protein ABIP21_08990 [Acidimicrobiia bacterium]